MPELDAGFLIRLLFCFAVGSIPFAVIALAGTGIDIRQVGSGNPGFNNVLRVSRGRAVLTLIGDLGKGMVAVWLFSRPTDGVLAGWLYGAAVVAGHCFSPWLRFIGGKGVATSGGVMFVMYPGWAAVALGFFVVLRMAGSRLKWKEAGMIASLSAWTVFTVLMLAFRERQDAAAAALMTLFLVWRHRKNLENLRAAAP